MNRREMIAASAGVIAAASGVKAAVPQKLYIAPHDQLQVLERRIDGIVGVPSWADRRSVKVTNIALQHLVVACYIDIFKDGLHLESVVAHADTREANWERLLISRTLLGLIEKAAEKHSSIHRRFVRVQG